MRFDKHKIKLYSSKGELIGEAEQLVLNDEVVESKPKRTKQEILSMIDIALDNKDEKWFKELTDQLKGMN